MRASFRSGSKRGQALRVYWKVRWVFSSGPESAQQAIGDDWKV